MRLVTTWRRGCAQREKALLAHATHAASKHAVGLAGATERQILLRFKVFALVASNEFSGNDAESLRNGQERP